MRTPPIAGGSMEGDRKAEGSYPLAAGRLEELRRLEASERALADAFTSYARAAPGGSRLLHHAARHRQHAEILAERLRQLGGEPAQYPDDIWIVGPSDHLDTLLFAEQKAHLTYRDHMMDFDPDTMRLVRDRIL